MTAVRQQRHIRQRTPPASYGSTHGSRDDSVPRSSPSLKALHPKLQPSPTPSPELSTSQTSAASSTNLMHLAVRQHPGGHFEHAPRMHSSALRGPPDLHNLASDVMYAVSDDRRHDRVLPKLNYDISASTRHLSLRDDPLPRPHNMPADSHSTSSMTTSISGELPPLQMGSPKSEMSSQILPSIRSALGDINRLPAEPATPSESDAVSPPHYNRTFSRSPPSVVPPLNKMVESLSPPISPDDSYRRSLPPSSQLPGPNSMQFAMNSVHASTPSDQLSRHNIDLDYRDQVSSPDTSRMGTDDGTSSQPGGYVCTFAGCTAHPFQTQYLLNSHANVHSSARPHYCPVKGCPRSEGGKGFKRKNEMIRHGLVHDSPGYVCPFCPDREHRYPRPDNLQRYL